MIERPNRAVLNQALDEFRDAMRLFILRNMKRIKGRTIESAIYDSLSDRQAGQFRANLQSNGGSIEGAIDIGDFPNLIRRNWTEVFSLKFHGDMNIQGLLHFIREARNNASHPSNEDLDTEYTRVALYHIIDVLGKINAPEAKASVEKERDKLFQVPSREPITLEPTEASPSTPRSGEVIPPKLKILILSSYTRKQKYKSDNCIRSEDFESPARLERRIKELSGYSAPAGEMFTGPLHTQLRQGLKQIREHEQYGENTLDLYFPGYACRVDRKKIPVSENDPIVPFNIAPPQEQKALEYDETGFLESMETLIEGYDLVLSILRWNDIVRLQRVFEVERTATLIFLIAPSHKHVVDDSLSNVHIVEAGTNLSRAIGAMNVALNGVVLRRLCEAACRNGFHVFEQIKQNPQRLVEIVRSQ